MAHYAAQLRYQGRPVLDYRLEIELVQRQS